MSIKMTEGATEPSAYTNDFFLFPPFHRRSPDTGTVHVYYSRYLYIDVGDLLQSDQVPVYIDRMNDSIGFVDIDAVLPKIQIHR